MEITVRKFDLLRELLLLQGAVERKTTMPILSNILIEATPEGRLLLSATDLELAIETSCPATVKQSGACALPARKLLDYVKLLPDAALTLKLLENHWVQLRCGRANTRMVGMSRENFPQLPLYPSAAGVRLPAPPLRAMIGKTIFAISGEETRYTLSGALLLIKPSSLTLVATDGHRLAHVVQGELELTGVGTETRALVPKKALAELLGLLDEGGEEAALEFAQDDTQLYFRVRSGEGDAARHRVLAARKLTGQFPNFEAVLPKSQLQSVPLPREEFQASLRRVAQFADERSHAIRVRLEPNKLILAASSSDMGESEEELEADFSGDGVVIGFNSEYLDEFLNVVSDNEVLLEFKDESSAGQLRPRSPDGMQYRYVVMPMRI